MIHGYEGAAAQRIGMALLTLLVGLGGCAQKEPTTAVLQAAQASDLAMISVPVDGMSCSACAASVKKTLVAIDGVASAEIDLGGRAARIRYDPQKVSAERLVAAVKELGYRTGAPTRVE